MSLLMGPRSFGTKALLAMCLASATAVALTCLLLVPMQFSRKRALVESTLATQARVIAVHSTAALSFEDAQAGHETLAALYADPDVGSAVIYDARNRLFAVYRRPGVEAPPSPPGQDPSSRIDHWYVLARPIIYDDRQLGTLVISYDVGPLYDQLWRDVARAMLAALASFLLAALLALWLRRLLVRPVADLANTAQAIADTGDYTARARQYSRDELGRFTVVFNQMLDRIEHQDEQIQQANRELRQRNHEMEQFVYTVSHDLKSPLVTITGFVGLLRQDVAEGRLDDLLDSTDHLTRASTRMSELIDDLLQLSRIGRVPNDLERVNVGDLIRDVTEDLESRFEAAGCKLEVQDDMPPVIADRLRLTQVFDNLLTNAIKYGCDDPQPLIRVGGVREGDEVRFFVRDNGDGIASQYHGKIFGLFQRLENRAEGTGVGLAIVARIVESHGGRVWVESSPGQGATFWIALPTRPSPSAHASQQAGAAGAT